MKNLKPLYRRNHYRIIAFVQLTVRIVITVLLVLIAFFHIFGLLILDLNDVAIFIAIALIWFAPALTKYIDTIEFGGNKITFRKFQQTQEKLENADLMPLQRL